MSDFSTTFVEGAAVVRFPRRVDVTNTRNFVEVARGLIAEDHRAIILDLEGTEAIDSTGLGAMVQIFKSVHVGEGTLLLANVPPSIEQLLAMTRLNRVFTRYASIAEAAANLRRAS